MTSIRSIVIVFATVALLGVGNLAAEDESPVSVSFDTTFVNKYIWRGQNLNNNASLQPGISIGYKGLTISSWSQFSHTGFGDSDVAGNHWTEHDFTMDYVSPSTTRFRSTWAGSTTRSRISTTAATRTRSTARSA